MPRSVDTCTCRDCETRRAGTSDVVPYPYNAPTDDARFSRPLMWTDATASREWAEARFAVDMSTRPLVDWTWFASIAIVRAEFCADEWAVKCAGDTLYSWVAADGIASQDCHTFFGDDPGKVTVPDGGWLFGYRIEAEAPAPTFALQPTTEDNPGPAPYIAPPSPRDVAEDEDDDEPRTCSDCDNLEENCECYECSHSRCHRRGPVEAIDYCSTCECCGNHCNCVECSRCDWRGDSVCDCCERCSECCDCNYCDACETHTRQSLCDRHNQCGDCCDRCGVGEHPEFVDRNVCFHTAMRGEFTRNPSRRHIGVEVEVQSVGSEAFEDIERVCKKWRASITSDGSLDDDTGFEIPTAPASGDQFCDQIEELCGALAKGDAQIDKSCGLHVHVDARDFRHYDMRRLVLLYAKVEAALFATQPESRAESGYCDPCGSRYVHGLMGARANKASKHTLMANVYVGPEGSDRRDHEAKAAIEVSGRYDSRPVKTKKYSDVRYHALNLHSWVLRGTVECRLHTGSVDAGKIIAWGVFWAALLDYAMRASEASIVALRLDTLRDQQAFLHDVIAPTDEVRAYLRDRWYWWGNVYNPTNKLMEVA